MVCEPFTQWVLEDDFADGRPPLEDAGVQLVDDVEPYELMKLRLLNASHQALCYLGYLAGYRLRARGRARTRCSPSFLLAYMDREAHADAARRCPGIDLDAYKRELDRAVLQRRRSATPWPGCAPRAPTASPSGCCR